MKDEGFQSWMRYDEGLDDSDTVGADLAKLAEAGRRIAASGADEEVAPHMWLVEEVGE